MFYVTITEPGWAGYTGPFAGIEFADGRSVSPVSRLVADHAAAAIRVDIEDMDGEQLGQGGAAARIAAGREVSAPLTLTLGQMTEEGKFNEDRMLKEKAANFDSTIYSRDQLEVIASKEGIKGLRAIGDNWNVKDRAIPKLIEQIMKAQTKYVAEKQKRLDKLRETRRTAEEDALMKQIELEQEIAAKARVYADTTPNAIGPNGQAIYTAPAPVAVVELPVGEKLAIDPNGLGVDPVNLVDYTALIRESIESAE